MASESSESTFELWYGDGVRFDLLPVSRDMWHSKGKRPFIPTPGTNVRVAVCGAYRYPDGPFLSTYGPRNVNTDMFLALLTLLVNRAKRTGRVIVIVLDNAGYFRKAKRAQVRLESISQWVIVFWLPKYTSEKLNRIENVWGHLKDDYFSRMLVRRRERLITKVVKLMKRLRRKGALAKLFGSHLPT
jgi:transposase